MKKILILILCFIILANINETFASEPENSISLQYGNLQSDNFKNSEYKTEMSIKSSIFKSFDETIELQFTGLDFSDRISFVNPLYSKKNLYEFDFNMLLKNEDYTIRTGIGSASDKLFNSLKETNLSVAGLKKIYGSQTGFLSAGIMLSNHPEYPVLPALMYMYFSKALVISAPAPLNITCNMTDNFQTSLFYMPSINMKLQLDYSLTPEDIIGASFEMQENEYSIADRADRKERLFIRSKKIELSYSRIFSNAKIVFALGSLIDGDYFYGRESKTKNEVNKIQSAGFGRIFCEYNF